MFPKAEQTGKAVQNSPCGQWEAGGAGRIEEALKGAGKKSQMWEGILAEMKGGLLSKACTGSRRTELAICYAENLWVCL